jgi:hypothetical protein
MGAFLLKGVRRMAEGEGEVLPEDISEAEIAEIRGKGYRPDDEDPKVIQKAMLGDFDLTEAEIRERERATKEFVEEDDRGRRY